MSDSFEAGKTFGQSNPYTSHIQPHQVPGASAQAIQDFNNGIDASKK